MAKRRFRPGDLVRFRTMNRYDVQPCTPARPCFECTPWLDLVGMIEEVWTKHGFNRARIRIRPAQYQILENTLMFAMIPNLTLVKAA